MNLWAGKSLGHDGIRKKKQGEVVGNGVPSWRLCRWNQGLASAPSKGHLWTPVPAQLEGPWSHSSAHTRCS